MIRNLELFTDLRNLYSRVDIHKATFSFVDSIRDQTIFVDQNQAKHQHFSEYIKKLEEILLEEIALTAVGKVVALTPLDAQSEIDHLVWIEAEISNRKERIKVKLNKEKYNLAIDAYKEDLSVSLKGKARRTKSQYYISEIDKFEIYWNE